jgi:predicted Fe-S protein YdhL (DUF1289 family)
MSSRTELCEGCFRTLREIADWMNYTRPEKEAILAQLGERRAAVKTASAFD